MEPAWHSHECESYTARTCEGRKPTSGSVSPGATLAHRLTLDVRTNAIVPSPIPLLFLFVLFFAMGIHSLSLGTPIPFKKGDPARRRKESGRKERERKSVSCRKRKRAAPTIGRTAGSTTPDPRQGQAKCARPRPRCPHLRAMVPLAGTRCTSRARPTNDQRTASRAPCLCCATGARSETTGMTAGSIKPTLLGMERPFHVFHPLLLLMLRQYFCTFDTAKR